MSKKSLISLMLGAVVLCGASVAGAASPWYYSVTGPNGSNEITIDQLGQILPFELDSITPDYVWGNIRVDFDPNMLECVSIEEVPAGPGFWAAWVTQTADPAYGGGGSLYYYDSTGLGLDWAQQWVAWYGQGIAGPVASYDNAQGIIRLYTFSDAGGYNGSVPLRIGFRIKQAGTAVFTTAANDWTAFGWPAAFSTPSLDASPSPLAAGEGYSWRLEDLPYQYTSTVQINPSVLEVPMDVKPATCPNIVNAKSGGALQTALLGTRDFDVTTVDRSSIRAEGVSPLQINASDVATPYEPYIGKDAADDCTSAGPDGLMDLVLKLDNREVVTAIETRLGRPVLNGETIIVTLTGNLKTEFGGTPIQGEDVVVIKR